MIIAVTDRKISKNPNFLEQIEAIASASPDMLILREKDLSELEYAILANECAGICNKHNVHLCVNSFIGVARKIGSRSIQLPFDIFKENINHINEFQEIWVSVHSVKEAADAERSGATHLIYGNVFETSCKSGVKGKGIRELKNICNSVHIPVFAIGGINEDNIRSVMDAGCKGVCIRSILMSSCDPSDIIKKIRSK